MNHKKPLCKAIWLTLVMLMGLILSVNAYAQRTSAVKVTVRDAEGTLIGANVAVKGTSIGANTDAFGVVTLNNVPSNAVLEVSFVGYKTQDIPVAGKQSIEVFLEEDTNLLDELVVIGYGTVRKRDLTGAVSQVKSKDLTAFSVSNPLQALQGRVAGLNLTTNGGSPQGDFNIRIRGTNSIKGSNDPLYIIDGMPASMSSINPYDIESIEVLKDASATAIYGSRGANGVVLVTTKSGRSGRTQVNYNFEYGISSLRKQYDVLDDAEWMEFTNLSLTNQGKDAYFSDSEIAARRGKGKTYNWSDGIYHNAPTQQHNVSVTGGNQSTRFAVSGSAMLRDGIIKNSNYNKYNFRSSIDHDINKYWNITVKTGYTYTTRLSKSGGTGALGLGSNRGNGITSAAYLAPPTITPFNDDGSYRVMNTTYPFISNVLANPINIMDASTSKTEANLIDMNASLTFKPFKGFSFKSSWGLENNDYRSDDYTNHLSLTSNSKASVSFTRNTTAITENIANYDVTIADDHKLNLMGGFTYQQNVTKGLSASGEDFVSDVLETYALSSASIPGVPSTSYTKWVLMSWLGRVNYSYKGKYLFTASGRYDGSSRYSPGSKWGFFPSCAVAWHVSEEPWLKDNRTISDLKIRAGYGVTGSTAISPYTTQNVLRNLLTPSGNKGTAFVAYDPTETFPGFLKWESTAQYDLGLDLALFQNRLRLTADAYYKLTTNLLNTVYLPQDSGYTSTTQNIGAMSNRGLEFLLEGIIVNTKDWSWTASANVTFNRNRVEKLAGGADLYGSNLNMSFVTGTVNLIREGEPMGVFYVYKADGYDDNGKIKYEMGEDGILNAADRQILGNPHPKFYGGFNTEVSYKNVALSMLWNGSYGNDVYAMCLAQFYDYGMGLNVLKDVYNNHWDKNNTPEQNAAAKYPNIIPSAGIQQSDLLIHDASYLRLKNIQLSYTLPIPKKIINRATIYVSAQNILTITKYPGLDPEVNAYGSDTTIGIDFQGYPMTKTVSFGANIQF